MRLGAFSQMNQQLPGSVDVPLKFVEGEMQWKY